MKARTVPVVFNRVGSCYAGAGEFTGLPIDVKRFGSLRLHVWRGPLNGTNPGFGLDLQGSTNQNVWVDYEQQLDPGPDAESTTQVLLPHRFFRWRIVLTGSDPMVSCHIHGSFFIRDRERL